MVSYPSEKIRSGRQSLRKLVLNVERVWGVNLFSHILLVQMELSIREDNWQNLFKFKMYTPL